MWCETLHLEPAIPRPLKHSEVPITFSREDQWTSFSERGKFSLVLDPVVAGSRLTRVLIDGGSGLKEEVLAAAKQLSQSRMEIPTKKANQSAPKPPDNLGVKTIQLLEGDSSKTALMGTGLTDK